MENKGMKRLYKILFSIILAFMALLVFSTKESKALTTSQTIDGVRWNYTYTKTGTTATNVYASSYSGKESLTVPSTLGGKTVTSVGYTYSSRNMVNSTSNSTITSIEIPSSVVTINAGAFSGMKALTSVTGAENVTLMGSNVFNGCTSLQTYTIPPKVTSIPASAFNNCTALKSIDIHSDVTSIGNDAFRGCTALTGDLIIPSGVATLGTNCFQNCTGLDGNLIINSTDLIAIPNYAFSGCTNFKRITLPSTVKQVGSYAFDGQKDIYVDGLEGDINFSSNFGGEKIPFVHYKGCTHKLSASTLDGIKIVNTDTGEELTEVDMPCGSNVNLSLVIEDGYNYDNLVVVKTRNGDYVNSEDVSEKVEGQTILIHSLTRDTIITTQNISNGLELVLRKYISNINGNEPDVSRAPKISIASVSPKYLHTKYPLIVESGDIITYTIEVYNQGSQPGYAKLITEYLPEGLEFIEDNEINNKYGWQASGDGTTLTTEYLKDTLMTGYTGVGSPTPVNIQIVCRVTATQDDTKVVRLTNVSELSAQSDIDENPISPNFSIADLPTYKYDEAVNSNSASYIEGQEKDDDFENVVILRKIPVTYTLKISKVDYATLELINGAKFDLLNEQREVIQSGVTVKDGTLQFDPITTYDDGVDIYYISETETPEGYEPTTDSIIKIKIVKTILDKVTESYKIRVECDIIDSYVDTRVDESLVIPIYTKEQLAKIGSGETISINGDEYTLSADRNYRLMSNIDLSGSEWTPITKNLTGIFDGNNKTITGLTITDKTKKSIGLFAVYSGVIQNLNLEDVNINIDLSNEIKAIENNFIDKEIQAEKLQELLDSYYVGALVGKMQGGAILNSKVDGAIKSDSNSVGGFIGYADSGYLVVMKNCINNSSVTSSSYNVGGLIGNSHSALTIKSCTNNGTITAGKYNAGGLVGYEEASEYTSNTIRVEYDDKSDVINLVVRNSKVDQYYTIILRKKDADTDTLIDGSKFSVYDSNKNIIAGLEDVELTDGVLKLDPIKMESSGTDTYYIKEVLAPDGYDLIDEYIKVKIKKSWDGANSKYVLNSNNSDTSDSSNEDSNKSDESGEKAEVGTGANYTFVETDGVTWLANKAIVMDSVNNGKIIAGYINASGIIAKTNCIVDVESSINKGEIEAGENAAGILAEAERKDENTTIDVNECTNDGVIKIVPKSDIILGSASGLVSYSKAKTTITNSTNNANVVGTIATSAGIIANMEDELYINNCKNTGAIESYDIASGILGKFLNRSKTATIVGTTNEGNITGVNQTAGIVSLVNSQKLVVEDSKNYKADITARGSTPSGGIVAMTASDIEIKNCSVEESTIMGNTGTESGILGYAGEVIIGGQNEVPTFVNVELCSVKKINITGLSGVKAAIVGKILDNGAGIKTAIIKDCTTEDVSIVSGSDSAVKSDSLVAGFIQKVTDLTIDNCDVKNSSIKVESNGLYDSGIVAGMIMQNNATDCSTYISNCDVENVNVSSNASGHMGGIVGFIKGAGSAYKSPITISNCNLKDTEIITKNSYADVAGIVVKALDTKAVSIDDCDITDSKLEANATYSNDLKVTSGIVGIIESSEKIEIENCDVNSSSIETITGKVAGIASEIKTTASDYGIQLENCNVVNSQILGDGENIGTCRSAGIAGQTFGSNINIKDCNVKSTDESKKVTISGRGMMGSMIAYTEQSVKLENSNANNVEIISSGTGETVGGAFGIVGTIDAKKSKFENINIVNGSETGGFIGYSGKDVSINESTFNNIGIEVNAYAKSTTGGIIGIANKSFTSNGNTYEYITVSANDNSSCSVGGIAGYMAQTATMSDDTIAHINVTNTRSSTYVYTGGVAGISITVDMTNENISNINVVSNCSAGGIIGVGSISVNDNEDGSAMSINNISIKSENKDVPVTIGGIVGIYASNGNLNNININELTMSTSCPQTRIGGIAGIINNIPVSNCHITGATISSTYDGGNISSTIDNHVGGVIGISTGGSISNCSVSGSSVNAKNGAVGGIVGGSNSNITDSPVNNTTVGCSNYGYVGGILGHDNGNLKIANSNVTGATIENNGGNTGGIAGYAAGTVQYSNLTNTNITATGTSSFGVGGIVGQGFNIKQYSNSEYTKINNCVVTDCNIAGYAAVGGIAGAAVPEITSCKVIGKIDSVVEEKAATVEQNMKLTSKSRIENKNEVIDDDNELDKDVKDSSAVKNEVNGTVDDKVTADEDDSNSTSSNKGSDDNETSGIAVMSTSGDESTADSKKPNNTEGNQNEVVEELKENVSINKDLDSKDVDTNSDIQSQDNGTEVDTKLTESVDSVTKNKTEAVRAQSLTNDDVNEETSNTDAYKTTISGTTYIGGIIGYGGDLSSPYHLAVTITDCQIENVKVEGLEYVDEVIGKNSFYGGSYQGTLTDEIVNFIKTNLLVNLKQ